MAEVGQVIEKNGQFVTVKMHRQDACSKCGACAASASGNEMTLTARNQCKAEVGDFVNINLDSHNFLGAVFIMYIVPLIAFLVGIGLGYIISQNELIAVVSGLALTAITYITIRILSNRLNMDAFKPIADQIMH